jgi:hypothetical protein
MLPQGRSDGGLMYCCGTVSTPEFERICTGTMGSGQQWSLIVAMMKSDGFFDLDVYGDDSVGAYI